jgi:hypothetical protein
MSLHRALVTVGKMVLRLVFSRRIATSFFHQRGNNTPPKDFNVPKNYDVL